MHFYFFIIRLPTIEHRAIFRIFLVWYLARVPRVHRMPRGPKMPYMAIAPMVNVLPHVCFSLVFSSALNLGCASYLKPIATHQVTVTPEICQPPNSAPLSLTWRFPEWKDVDLEKGLTLTSVSNNQLLDEDLATHQVKKPIGIHIEWGWAG